MDGHTFVRAILNIGGFKFGDLALNRQYFCVYGTCQNQFSNNYTSLVQHPLNTYYVSYKLCGLLGIQDLTLGYKCSLPGFTELQ